MNHTILFCLSRVDAFIRPWLVPRLINLSSTEISSDFHISLAFKLQMLKTSCNWIAKFSILGCLLYWQNEAYRNEEKWIDERLVRFGSVRLVTKPFFPQSGWNGISHDWPLRCEFIHFLCYMVHFKLIHLSIGGWNASTSLLKSKVLLAYKFYSNFWCYF